MEVFEISEAEQIFEAEIEIIFSEVESKNTFYCGHLAVVRWDRQIKSLELTRSMWSLLSPEPCLRSKESGLI